MGLVWSVLKALRLVLGGAISPVLQHPQVLLQCFLLLPELVILGKELLYPLCVSVWQITEVGRWSWYPAWPGFGFPSLAAPCGDLHSLVFVLA